MWRHQCGGGGKSVEGGGGAGTWGTTDAARASATSLAAERSRCGDEEDGRPRGAPAPGTGDPACWRGPESPAVPRVLPDAAAGEPPGALRSPPSLSAPALQARPSTMTTWAHSQGPRATAPGAEGAALAVEEEAALVSVLLDASSPAASGEEGLISAEGSGRRPSSSGSNRRRASSSSSSPAPEESGRGGGCSARRPRALLPLPSGCSRWGERAASSASSPLLPAEDEVHAAMSAVVG